MIPIVIVVREECQIFRYHSFFLVATLKSRTELKFTKTINFVI